MEAIIFYLCKVATFQKEVTYSEWCISKYPVDNILDLAPSRKDNL